MYASRYEKVAYPPSPFQPENNFFFFLGEHLFSRLEEEYGKKNKSPKRRFLNLETWEIDFMFVE